jgi:hypothetical protein
MPFPEFDQGKREEQGFKFRRKYTPLIFILSWLMRFV